MSGYIVVGTTVAVILDELIGLTDHKLFERLQHAQPGSSLAMAVQTEFMRRTAVAQRNTAEAMWQTSIYVKHTARWTKFSSILIAVNVVVVNVWFLIATLGDS